MRLESRASFDDEVLLAEVATEFFERISQGESPVVEEYVQRYPEIADLLRKALPALHVVHDSVGGAESNKHPSSGDHEGRLGDFRILHEVGRGGMGIVYEAEQVSMGGRKVALKVLPFAALVDDVRLQRFRNEVQAAASLDHPNIVPVYSVGEDRGVHYFAMRLIRGQSLAALIRDLARATQKEPQHVDPLMATISSVQREPSSSRAAVDDEPDSDKVEIQASIGGSDRDETAPRIEANVSTQPIDRAGGHDRTVAELGIQACDALRHAHERGVVHRDIKPDNLLVDFSAQLHVTDFGLAHIEQNAGITMTGDLLGTLRYMSPEQAAGKREGVDYRTDLYSLGVTLYELATLEPAFPGENRATLIHQIVHSEPTLATQRNTAIPRDLGIIIQKAMAKEPGDRYDSATEMGNDLRAFAAGQPISAKPPSIIVHFSKWIRRNQRLASAAAAVLLLLIGGLVISNTLIASERTKTKEALVSEKELRTIAEQRRQVAERLREEADTQRKRAEESEELARHESEFATALNRFLVDDLLGNASPNKNKYGVDLTVEQLMDLAAASAATKLAEEPEVQAEVNYVVGDAYHRLTRFDKAAKHFESAWRTFQQIRGELDERSVECGNRLARIYLESGRLSQAAEVLERSVKTLEQNTDEKNVKTRIRSLRDLATTYHELGRRGEAIEQLEKSILLSKDHFGARHFQTVFATIRLAGWHAEAGAKHLAKQLLEDAYALQQESILEGNTMCQLGNALGDLGDFEKAEEVLEKTRAVAKHPGHITKVNYFLGHLYLRSDELDQAEDCYLRSLEASSTHFGETHFFSLQTTAQLGELYYCMEDYEKAREPLERAIAGWNSAFGEDHEGKLRTLDNLCKVHAVMGDRKRAEESGLELVERRARVFGEYHPATLRARWRLGCVYREGGEFTKAREQLQRVVKEAHQQLGPGHPHTIDGAAALGQVLFELSDMEGAESHLTKAMNGHRQLGHWNLGLAECLESLGRLRVSQSRYGEAADLFRESLRSRDESKVKRWSTYLNRSRLGGALLAQAQYAEAEPLIIDGLTGLRNCRPTYSHEDRAQMKESIVRAIDLYTQLDRPEDAQRYREQLSGADSK